MTKQQIIARAKAQVALEYSCAPDAFDGDGNIITVSRLNEGRREYRPGAHFLSMASFGRGAVITADERIHSWLAEYLESEDEPIQGHWLFEHHRLSAIDAECRKYGKKISGTFHMYLPDERIGVSVFDVKVKWYEQDEIIPFYGNEQGVRTDNSGEKPVCKIFPNALSPAPNPHRPDMLAVAAYDGDLMTGMAGASADTPDMWQIGIDILPGYRGRGIAAQLVTQLKNEVLRQGFLPFYGTSLSNLGSQNVARASGFYPAWIEATTEEPGWGGDEK